MRSVRGIPDHEWQEARAAAKRAKLDVGEWITASIRAKLAAERAPVEIEAPGPTWGERPRITLLEVEAGKRLIEELAQERTGRNAGKPLARHKRAVRLALEAALAPYDRPAPQPLARLSHKLSDNA